MTTDFRFYKTVILPVVALLLHIKIPSLTVEKEKSARKPLFKV